MKRELGAVIGVLGLALAVQNGKAANLPSWIGATATHHWQPALGGVYWLDSRAVVKQAAPCLSQSSRPVLVDIKSDATGFGYRFDLDSWDSRSAIYSYYRWDGTDGGTPASPEDAFNILGATGNAQFVLNLPIPRYLTNTPSSNWGYDGHGYTWQTPQFYAALAQYLFGASGPQSEWQGLPTHLDFFSQPGDFNWADLRARRGHLSPYPVVAVILGEEPYNLEGFPEGAAYGAQAEQFRAAIRNRGVTVPLGLHVHDMGIVDNPSPGTWFWPMMTNLVASDFSYLDLEHYYQFSTAPEDFKRAFPISINTQGFQGWWMPQSQWRSDYTKFLWIAEDTRNAISDDRAVSGLGDPGRWQLGFSEHGVQVTSAFMYNDMLSAMHWAGWLAESMRQNILWDSGWTLLGEGFATAQLQVVDGYLTRTPMFYVYQMAQEFYGLDYLTNSYVSAAGATTDNVGKAVQFPWTTVRTFSDPATGYIHLFVLNQSPTDSATISGFENWSIVSWNQLAASSYTNCNPLGVAGPEPIQTRAAALPAPGMSLVIPPVSVNHIILSAPGSTNSTAGTAPTVSMSSPANNSTVSNSVTVVASATDSAGIAGVQLTLDDANLGRVLTLPPYSLALDTTVLTDGPHTLSATAWDPAGNQGTATPVLILVSNLAVAPLGLPAVSVAATVPATVIGTTNFAAFTFIRTGETTVALTVDYALGGTAVKWTDYRREPEGDMPVSVTIPAGSSSYTMEIAGVTNSTGADPATASVTLSPGPGYTIGAAGSAAITLVSSLAVPPPTLTVAVSSPSASRVGPVNGAFRLTRTGSTSAALTVNYSLGGTAVNGTDYSLLGDSLTIPAGAASATLTVAPKPATSFVASESVVVALSADPAYQVGSQPNAALTMAGNTVPSTITAGSGGKIEVTWASVIGKAYRIAYKTSLTDGAWTNLSGPFTATSTTTSYAEPAPAGNAKRYYVVYVTD